MISDSAYTAPSPDPALAALLPPQGEWSEQDYLWLSGRTRHLVELVDGAIEVLPMPTDEHQRILMFLYRLLYGLGIGIVLPAPLRLRLASGRFREPDLLLLLDAADPRRHNEWWDGADLVVEVVSPDDPQRDLVTKRAEYAQSGIPEYWIIGPQVQHITVLSLKAGQYVEHGVFERGTIATSALLPELQTAVDAVFDAE